MLYNPISRNHLVLCDGGDPNGSLHPILVEPIHQYTNNMEFMAQSCYLTNNSGSSVVLGVGSRKAKHRWKAGQWTSATTTYNDDTTDAQSGTATDFPMETLTVNDGMCIFCQDKFNLISFLVATASVGASVVRDFAYSKAGAWSIFTIANLVIVPPSTAGQQWTVGENLAMWNVFPDWDLTTGAEGTNVPPGYYGVRFRATTVPTTAGVSTSMSLHLMTFFQEAVATATRVALIAPGNESGSSLGPGDAASVVFSVLGSNKNRIEAEVRARG